jgi:hypothetical protein
MIEGKYVFIRQLEVGDEENLYKWWNDGDMTKRVGKEGK